MPITLSPEVTTQLLASIKRFSAEHLDEEVGDLKAQLILDFCLAEVGGVVYNRAVADVQRRLLGAVTDVDGVCYEPEFAYWTRPGSRSRS